MEGLLMSEELLVLLTNDIEKDKKIERLSKNNTILENKLNMIKENIETIDKKTIIEIIDNYTGFWGSDKE